MTENHQNGSPEPHAYAGPETFDTEIGVRGSIMTMVWVFGISIVTAVLVWLMMLGFGKLETMTAKPMTPIQEANPQAPLPPEPRLERSPYANLDEMRAEENELQKHSGWVDREQGVVRLSIDEAIGVLAERGLPGSAAPAAPTPGATTVPGAGAAIPPDVQPPPPPAAAPIQPPPPGGRP